MCGRYATLIFLLCMLLANCGFPESCFDLSPESKLPAWFSLPSDVLRGKAEVHMCYYIGEDGMTSTVEMRVDGRRDLSADAVGTLRDRYPLNSTNAEASPSEYPKYEVITVGSVTEVLEHRHRAAYVADDAKVRQSLGVTATDTDQWRRWNGTCA